MHCGFYKIKLNKHILFWPMLLKISNLIRKGESERESERESHWSTVRSSPMSLTLFIRSLLSRRYAINVCFLVNRLFGLHKFDSTSFNAKSYRNSHSYYNFFLVNSIFFLSVSSLALTHCHECINVSVFSWDKLVWNLLFCWIVVWCACVFFSRFDRCTRPILVQNVYKFL